MIKDDDVLQIHAKVTGFSTKLRIVEDYDLRFHLQRFALDRWETISAEVGAAIGKQDILAKWFLEENAPLLQTL